MGTGLEYVAMAVVAAASYDQQEKAEDKAYAANQQAREEQKGTRAEQQAQNAAKAAAEKRRQFREQRIKTAQIIQASENTGTGGSSGAIGAVGNVATQTSTGIGFNNSMLASTGRQSIFEQNASDLQGVSQGFMQDSNKWGGIGNLALNFAVSGIGKGGGGGTEGGAGSMSGNGSVQGNSDYQFDL